MSRPDFQRGGAAAKRRQDELDKAGQTIKPVSALELMRQCVARGGQRPNPDGLDTARAMVAECIARGAETLAQFRTCMSESPNDFELARANDLISDSAYARSA